MLAVIEIFGDGDSPEPSHELAALESGDILRRQFEPLSVPSSGLKSAVPIRFNARRIVTVDGVHEHRLFGDLDLQLAGIRVEPSN